MKRELPNYVGSSNLRIFTIVSNIPSLVSPKYIHLTEDFLYFQLALVSAWDWVVGFRMTNQPRQVSLFCIYTYVYHVLKHLPSVCDLVLRMDMSHKARGIKMQSLQDVNLNIYFDCTKAINHPYS